MAMVPADQARAARRLALRGLAAVILALAWVVPAAGSEAPVIRVLAEQFWPYSYSADGRYDQPPEGILVDFARTVLDAAGLRHEVVLLPWPRVMKHVREQPDQLVLTMIRSPDRDALVHWVGPVADVRHALYGKPARLGTLPRSLAEAQHLSVATVVDDIARDYLAAQGFERLVNSSTYLNGLEMLARGRVDLYPGNTSLIAYQCTQVPRGCVGIEPILQLDALQQSLHFALSAATDAATVERIRAAFRAQRVTGRLEAIRAQYLPAGSGKVDASPPPRAVRPRRD